MIASDVHRGVAESVVGFDSFTQPTLFHLEWQLRPTQGGTNVVAWRDNGWIDYGATALVVTI